MEEIGEEEKRAEEIHWPGCGLYAGWMLASIFGMGLGWIVAWLVSFLVPGYLATLLIGLITGTILGGLQWLVLRGTLGRSFFWIPATAIGWAGGFFIGSMAPNWFSIGETWLGPAAGFCVGALVGFFQWLTIRSQVTRAGWWLVASLAAWVSGMIYYQPGITWLGFLYGAISGIVTGLALVWLVNRPVEE